VTAVIEEGKLPQLHRDASDRFWEYFAEVDGLNGLLSGFLPEHRFRTRPEDICDHDERAAVVWPSPALRWRQELASAIRRTETFFFPLHVFGGCRYTARTLGLRRPCVRESPRFGGSPSPPLQITSMLVSACTKAIGFRSTSLNDYALS